MPEGLVRVRDLEMAYDDVGAGPPVLLLHGYPFNRSLWREQAEALRANYRVITPDLRGHGQTTATAQPATMDEMARDVAALLDALNIKRTILGGLSMGGYVSLAFYHLFPLRVRGLVLADTRPTADTDEGRATREQQAQVATDLGMAAIAENFLPKLLAPATFVERPEVVERVREMILQTKPQGAASAQRGMALRPDRTDFLPSILAPTLIIVGSLDEITPVRDAQLMHREIRGSHLEILEGAGHVSNLERAAEFTRALETFLDALQP